MAPLRSVPPWRRIVPASRNGVHLTAYWVSFASGRGLGMVSPARTRPAGGAGSYGFMVPLRCLPRLDDFSSVLHTSPAPRSDHLLPIGQESRPLTYDAMLSRGKGPQPCWGSREVSSLHMSICALHPDILSLELHYTAYIACSSRCPTRACLYFACFRLRQMDNL